MGAGVRAVLGDVSGEVAVFGSLNADLTVRTERFPKPGETISGEDLVILPGGKSANQAVQAGLLGARVRMIGAVGADGLIIEVHCHPEAALSDGDQSLIPRNFEMLMDEVRQIAPAVGRRV